MDLGSTHKSKWKNEMKLFILMECFPNFGTFMSSSGRSISTIIGFWRKPPRRPGLENTLSNAFGIFLCTRAKNEAYSPLNEARAPGWRALRSFLQIPNHDGAILQARVLDCCPEVLY